MSGFRPPRLTTFQTIILLFAAVILGGSLLLMLPFSTWDGTVTPFNQALFTATSAVCVTGLVVQDTATHWSWFGQAVILILIQIGGMGVITVAAFFSLLSGRKISLMQRGTMQEAIAAPKVGGIVRLTGFIIKASLLIEVLGAACMMPVFWRDYGLHGIWMAVFHSVSAFCNAGFDLLGTPGAQYASLTAYRANPVINLTIMALIVVGGLGFLTWDDIRANKLRLHRYRMQSKVILSTTALLILLPAVWFFFGEFAALPTGERLLASLFQSVTPRTAGFNTADLTALTGVGQGLTIVLMLIGGSPGSTAGGMKTTTLAVLFANAIAVFCRQSEPHFFGRRLDGKVVSSASTIGMMYLTLFLTGGFVISAVEGLPLSACLFETASAVGTVGLSLGLTPHLGLLSQGILIALMFIGRVGGLTLIYAALSGFSKAGSRLPQERITVG